VAVLVTTLRHIASSTVSLSGAAGEVLVSSTYFKRAGDRGLLVSAKVASGAVRVRFNGGTLSDVTTAKGDSLEASLDVTALAEGAEVSFDLVAGPAGGAIALLEWHAQRIEVR